MVHAPPESIVIEPWLIGVIVGLILMGGIVAIIFKLLQENGTNGVNLNFGLKNFEFLTDAIKKVTPSSLGTAVSANNAAAPVAPTEGFAEYQKSTTPKQLASPNASPATSAAAQSVSIPMQHLPVASSSNSGAATAATSAPVASLSNQAPPVQHRAVLAPAESIHYYDEKQFHDEEDSMAEYGYYGENGQFNEDGSFIGLYGQDRFQAVQDRIAAYAAQTQAQLKQLNSAS